jgi:alcohol dehydrogenase
MKPTIHIKESEMNLTFNYYMPTRILFGAGSLKEIGSTPYLPGKKALVVIGSSGAMRKHGYLDRLVKLLKDNGAASVVYDKILPNPVSSHVEEGASVARSEKCDFVLGLGGGSTMDSSKSIAVMAKNPGTYWDYISGGSGGGKNLVNGALPIVTVTTTAGTGSESDPWTVITKSDTQEKIGYGNEHTFPVLSIVDPELMLSVPPKTTAYTGMDAFFHSVEAYLATVSQPASDHLALESVSLISRYLQAAVKNGRDLEARTKLAWANTEAGICESLSSCISHHSLEHAVSALYPEVAHGAGLSALSVAYFSHIAERNPARFEDLGRAMGEDVEKLTKADRPFSFIAGLKKLLKNVDIAEDTLPSFKVKREDIGKLTDNAFYTMGGLFKVTPVEMTKKDVSSIYERAFA